MLHILLLLLHHSNKYILYVCVYEFVCLCVSSSYNCAFYFYNYSSNNHLRLRGVSLRSLITGKLLSKFYVKSIVVVEAGQQQQQRQQLLDCKDLDLSSLL